MYGGGERCAQGKPEGKRPLGRPRRRWQDNIKKDLQEVEGGYGDWMELARDRESWRALVSAVMNFRASWGKQVSKLLPESLMSQLSVDKHIFGEMMLLSASKLFC